MTTSDDPDWLWEFAAEDFVHARLAEERVRAEELPEGSERDIALSRVETLALAAVEHSPYVDRSGRSWARCVSCDPSLGFPCATMRCLTRLWRHHAEYRPGWNETLDGSGGPSPFQREQLELARLGGFRKRFLARNPDVVG